MNRPQPVLLRELAAIGPHFALVADGAADEGWRPVSALIGRAEELGAVVDEVAARLGTPERWIAASLFYQGWAARLTSVYAGSAALRGAVPDLRVDRVSYRLTRSGPVELSVAPYESVSVKSGWRCLYDEHLVPLADAIRRQVRIGRYLLLGNVGSALAGSLAVLADVRYEPLEALLGRDWARPVELAMSGHWVPTPVGPRYARTTCCGYEQLDRGGRCGDCSLSWCGLSGKRAWSERGLSLD
jgi:ferric iron reductase protein FhuF